MPTSAKPFMKSIATIKDASTGHHHVLFRVRIADGTKAKIELPRADLTDHKQLEKRLLSLGAILPPKGAERNQFISIAADAPDKRLLTRSGLSGWTNDNRNFIIQTKALGKGSDSILALAGPRLEDERGWIRRSGTFADWKASVGELALYSSHFMLCISAAFAAPLLRHCKEQSFAICISGYSRTGKSFASLMGASVIGIGQVERLLTWNTTDSAIAEQLPRFNDCLAPIDDFEGMEGTNIVRYRRIRQAAYGIAAGSEKSRHSSFPVPSKRWTTILVTSMEKTIKELSQAAKQTRNPGESVRMLDVPLLSSDQKNIFDRAAADGKGITPDWKKRVFEEIITACDTNHGVVFEKYIARLCKERKTIGEHTKKFRASFMKKVCRDQDGDMARDIARKFGLIYAGGRLAIEYGLVPWKKIELLESIGACYRASRDLLPDDGVALHDGMRLLDGLLNSLKRKSKIEIYSAVKGFKLKKPNIIQHFVKIDDFNAAFESITQRSLVLAHLIKTKRITMNRPKTKSTRPGPQQQFTWPDGSRIRSYKIASMRSSRPSK